MNNKILTEAELQHIEYCNKVLKNHLELVEDVTTRTNNLLSNYVESFSAYANSIAQVRQLFGNEVTHILNSTRQLKIATSGVQELITFIDTANKLNQLLNSEFIEKLNRIK